MAVNYVYPPIVTSSSSAFNKDVDSIIIKFSVPIIVNYDDVKHISIRVVQQSNNKTVVDTDTYYDGIIYKKKPTSNENGIYSIAIDTKEIKTNGKTGWESGMYYKIQIRFGYGEELYNLTGAEDETNKKILFHKWKKRLTSSNSFSEWSNIIITKAITPPIVEIANNLDNTFLFSSNVLRYSDNVEHTRFPKFEGSYTSDAEEPLDKYRYRLYEGRYSYDPLIKDKLEPYLDSGWLQYNGGSSEKYTAVTEYTFKKPLAYLGTNYYTVFYDTISSNEYYKTSSPYTFTVTEGVLNPIKHIDLVIKDNSQQKNYASRFSAATKNVFSAYKRMMDLPYDATFVEVDGTDIIYSTNASRTNFELNSVNDSLSVYLGVGSQFKLKEYESGIVSVLLKHELIKYKVDEDGNVVYDEVTKEPIEIAEEYFETLQMDGKDADTGLPITRDFKIRVPAAGADWGYELENNRQNYDIHYKKINKDYIPFVHNLTLNRKFLKNTDSNVKSDTLSLYVYSTDTYVILTKAERIANVSAFENTLRCDENGTLEIWIRNNPWYVEVEKYDDITGFNNYEITTRSQSMDGIYYLIRSDERSNFAIWEDLAKFDFYNKNDFDGQLKLLYEDFTIESGIRYKYALQRESLKGYRTPPKFEFNTLESSPAHWSNFQHTYIYANGVQVRLDLDVKIQQFKHTRLFQKQDPLNSKYPVILRNGLANYGEFSLGGKITLHSDIDGSFLLHKPEEYDNLTGLWGGGYYYNGDLVISPEKYMDLASRFKYSFDINDYHKNNTKKYWDGGNIDLNEKTYGYIDGINIDPNSEPNKTTISFDEKEHYKLITTGEYFNEKRDAYGDYKQGYSKFNFNHTNDNIFMERIYRKYVEEFLNDGGYKLYKSPNEGNMIVTLVNVSLVPNQQLGRLIADFNSTVYEVAENSCENIKLYDINPLDVMTNNMTLSFGDAGSRFRTVVGQVSGAYDGKLAKKLRISDILYRDLYNLSRETKNYTFEPSNYFKHEKNYYYTYDNLPTEMLAMIYSYFENLPKWFQAEKKQLDNLYQDRFSQLDKDDENYSNKLLSLDNWYNGELKELNAEINEKNGMTREANPYFNNVGDDIVDWIRLREEVEISDERIYELNRISYIWVELYPKYDLEQEITNLKSNTYDTRVNKLIKEMKLAQYQCALKQYDYSQSNVITLIIIDTFGNEQEINMMPGRVYCLDDISIQHIYLKYTRPVLINYIAQLEEVDNLNSITLAKQEINSIGQISGVFTTTKDILDNHYPYRDKESLIALEQYNYSLYQTLDVFDIIREKVKTVIFDVVKEGMGAISWNELEDAIDAFINPFHLASLSYEEIAEEAKNILKKYKPILKIEKNSTSDVWLDDKGHIIIYKLYGLEKLAIEADEGTGIIYNHSRVDSSTTEKEELASRVTTHIGPTEKYILQVENEDTENQIDYIHECRFMNPVFSIVDYNAIVSLEIKGNPMNN